MAPVNLRTYIEKLEGGQTKFARLLGVSQGLVWQWLEGRTRITAERACQIERLTASQVTRLELRPDLYQDDAQPAAGESEREAA